MDFKCIEYKFLFKYNQIITFLLFSSTENYQANKIEFEEVIKNLEFSNQK